MAQKSHEKFMFNMNIFDDHAPAEDGPEESAVEEPPEPLPPVFSESELEAAKKEAFEAGKQEGIAETKASRAQTISDVLATISENLPTLYAQETKEKNNLQDDLILITNTIFETLFPVFKEQFGTEQLQGIITDVLEQQTGHSEVIIKVHPDIVAGIEKFTTKLSEQNPDTHFSVLADETLSDHGCTLSWDNGGAQYAPALMAEEIKSILQQTLAGTPQPRHDDKDEQIMEIPDE